MNAIANIIDVIWIAAVLTTKATVKKSAKIEIQDVIFDAETIT